MANSITYELVFQQAMQYIGVMISGMLTKNCHATATIQAVCQNQNEVRLQMRGGLRIVDGQTQEALMVLPADPELPDVKAPMALMN
jgi:hypothetical protein